MKPQHAILQSYPQPLFCGSASSVAATGLSAN